MDSATTEAVMPGRIRTLKPEILENPRTASLSSDAFRLFIGCILQADDWGNLDADERRLHGAVFWARRPRIGVPRLLGELEDHSLLARYQIAHQEYAHILGWHEHQRVDRPARRRVPGPETATKSAASGPGEEPQVGTKSAASGPGEEPQVGTKSAASGPGEEPQVGQEKSGESQAGREQVGSKSAMQSAEPGDSQGVSDPIDASLLRDARGTHAPDPIRSDQDQEPINDPTPTRAREGVPAGQALQLLREHAGAALLFPQLVATATGLPAALERRWLAAVQALSPNAVQLERAGAFLAAGGLRWVSQGAGVAVQWICGTENLSRLLTEAGAWDGRPLGGGPEAPQVTAAPNTPEFFDQVEANAAAHERQKGKRHGRR